MSVLFLPPCSADCSGSVSDVSFSLCAPEEHWGEIAKVYVAPADLDLTGFDASDLADWTAKLGDTGDDKIRTLIGLGEMPEPDAPEVAISGNRKAYGARTYKVNFKVDETNDLNYIFAALTGCNKSYLFWFETSDGILYGGNDGIYGTIVAHQVIPLSRKEVVTINMVLSWESQMAPYRCTSPMY